MDHSTLEYFRGDIYEKVKFTENLLIGINKFFVTLCHDFVIMCMRNIMKL